ncbi:MAG: hypothetical protein D6735_13560 [Acidobacteria bacterium]|nr:MAG: hypothetical protein D6735_13560 [Acidobacteriota bacterium]
MTLILLLTALIAIESVLLIKIDILPFLSSVHNLNIKAIFSGREIGWLSYRKGDAEEYYYYPAIKIIFILIITFLALTSSRPLTLYEIFALSTFAVWAICDVLFRTVTNFYIIVITFIASLISIALYDLNFAVIKLGWSVFLFELFHLVVLITVLMKRPVGAGDAQISLILGMLIRDWNELIILFGVTMVISIIHYLFNYLRKTGFYPLIWLYNLIYGDKSAMLSKLIKSDGQPVITILFIAYLITRVYWL